MPESLEILRFVCNNATKSHETLMFVTLQKDAMNAVTPQSSIALIVSVVELLTSTSFILIVTSPLVMQARPLLKGWSGFYKSGPVLVRSKG